ncbi:unnamed protein product [Boreogadus saida]
MRAKVRRRLNQTPPLFSSTPFHSARRAQSSSKMELLLLCGILLAAFHTSHSNIPEFCNLPSDAGTGSERGTLIYYDPSDDNCYPFMYKGEGGNQNRFTNERDCVKNCSTIAEQRYPEDEREACHLPLVKGSVCTSFSLRFFYDPIHDKCKPFLWKGCLGNGNRFLSQQMCNETCDGIHDEGEGEEEAESDTPVALICGLSFGILGAIIIIVVVVLMVKSKDDPKKKGPKKPKREETPLQVIATE